ncbi:MAG: zinc-ribbon domain-containing protein, partial [Myxococcaceae bacterium]|nr:zinc-ribbon domain-containing protein [Myxococcaceae bacterium]
MRIVCSQCSAAYAIDDKFVTPKGVRAQCPRCRHLQLVKKEDAVAPAPASSALGVAPKAPLPPAGPSALELLALAPPPPAAPVAPPRPASASPFEVMPSAPPAPRRASA